MPPPPFEARFTLRSLAPRIAGWLVLTALSVVFALPNGPFRDLLVAVVEAHLQQWD